MKKTYKVLWIDDDCDGGAKGFIDQAEEFGLELKPFKYAEDGMNHLTEHWKKVDGIFLDRRQLKNSSDESPDEEGLAYCKDVINRLEGRESVEFPKVILTGYSDEEFKKRQPGYDVFNKLDREEKICAFKNLHAGIENRRSVELQNKYQQVHDACNSEIFQGADLWGKLEPLLEYVHYGTPIEVKEPYAKFGDLLDAISKPLGKKEIIPKKFTDNNGTVERSMVKRFIAGDSPLKLKWEKSQICIKKNVFPKIIQSQFSLVYEAQAIGHHPHEIDAPDPIIQWNTRHYDDFIPTNNLIKCLTFIATDLVLWTEQYINLHPDGDANAENWTKESLDSEGVQSGIVSSIKKHINEKRFGYFQPDGTKDWDDSAYIPPKLIKEHELEEGQRIKVKTKSQTSVTNIIEIIK